MFRLLSVIVSLFSTTVLDLDQKKYFFEKRRISSYLAIAQGLGVWERVT